MKINAKGIALIKDFETLKLEAYLCPAKVWTIGWGHTKGVKQGDKIDLATAERFLKEDIEEAERGVERLVKVKLNDNQFSALVSFVFNLGTGNFQKSTLLKVININPDSANVGFQLKKWVYSDGQILPGLVTRRAEEEKLYYS